MFSGLIQHLPHARPMEANHYCDFAVAEAVSTQYEYDLSELIFVGMQSQRGGVSR
ncbi:MAG: hypothetical protein IPK17_11275 [Chloroflexi bacterium]|uniref:hypothetical protein n=1 Tax=Candidatus Flexifilum breve TaxID=3140694 RepID=UPI0031376AE5|nr:hypothetical protein [Chloroflexota bacterium]